MAIKTLFYKIGVDNEFGVNIDRDFSRECIDTKFDAVKDVEFDICDTQKIFIRENVNRFFVKSIDTVFYKVRGG